MQVVQFFPGQGASGTGAGQGDPSMTVLTPAEQYAPGATFATPPGVTDDSVQLTWDSAAVTSVFVDGVPVTAFEGIGGSTFRLANLAVSNGTHVVTTTPANQGVGLEVYGYYQYTSYASAGPRRFQVLAPTLVP